MQYGDKRRFSFSVSLPRPFCFVLLGEERELDHRLVSQTGCVREGWPARLVTGLEGTATPSAKLGKVRLRQLKINN